MSHDNIEGLFEQFKKLVFLHEPNAAEIIRGLIRRGLDKSHLSYDDHRCLSQAYFQNRTDVVKVLVEDGGFGADELIAHNYDYWPFYFGNVEVVQILIDCGLKSKDVSSRSCSALYQICASGHLSLLNLLIAHRLVDAETFREFNCHRVSIAFSHDQASIVERLFEIGITYENVRKSNQALPWAVEHNAVNVLKFLHSRSLLFVDHQPEWALHMLWRNANPQIIKLFIDSDMRHEHVDATDGLNSLSSNWRENKQITESARLVMDAFYSNDEICSMPALFANACFIGNFLFLDLLAERGLTITVARPQTLLFKYFLYAKLVIPRGDNVSFVQIYDDDCKLDICKFRIEYEADIDKDK